MGRDCASERRSNRAGRGPTDGVQEARQGGRARHTRKAVLTDTQFDGVVRLAANIRSSPESSIVARGVQIGPPLPVDFIQSCFKIGGNSGALLSRERPRSHFPERPEDAAIFNARFEGRASHDQWPKASGAPPARSRSSRDCNLHPANIGFRGTFHDGQSGD
jgi:hypothetical protein